MEEGEADERVVGRDEQRSGEEAAEQRVVVADDRVLDDVRDQEQDDEVERRQLRQLALAGQVDEDDEREVDGERPRGLVDQAEVDEARVDSEV